MSRVELSPTDGWAVESVMSCCHLYAVDFVFSRYDGNASSRNGVDAMVDDSCGGPFVTVYQQN